MEQPPNPYLQFQQHPQQQPNYTQPQTYYPPKQPPIPPKKHVSRTGKILFSVIGAVVSIFILAIIIAIASCSAAPPVPNLNAAATANVDNLTATANNATVNAGLTAITSGLTQTAMTPTPVPPTPTPTQIPTPQSIQYPPRTIADLRDLAAKGDASAIHEFHSESVGAVGVCPEPRKAVTVDPSVTGKQLAEDLLAYFYTNQLDSPCGSLVLAYHNQGEANDAYTAGRINFDTTDASGASNFDPNATNLKYTLTLDIGDNATGQEYIVTY